MIIYKLKMKCPNLKAQVDMIQVREILNDAPGFNTVHFDLPNQTLEITSANQDAGRDILHRLDHGGFAGEDVEVIEMADHAQEPNDGSE